MAWISNTMGYLMGWHIHQVKPCFFLKHLGIQAAVGTTSPYTCILRPSKGLGKPWSRTMVPLGIPKSAPIANPQYSIPDRGCVFRRRKRSGGMSQNDEECGRGFLPEASFPLLRPLGWMHSCTLGLRATTTRCTYSHVSQPSGFITMELNHTYFM